jgi:xyloglucan-specific endo-beta-1,4-glucanase
VTTVTSKTTTTAPAPTSTYDAKKYCGQYDSTIVGPYTLYLNQWGLSGATSGSQCAQLTSFTGGNTVGFTTTWTFAGGNGVKSYTNINLNQGINKVLSTIKTIPVSRSLSRYVCLVLFHSPVFRQVDQHRVGFHCL